jgi:hypothetical protein
MSGNIQDPDSGRFRRDVRVIQLRFLEEPVGDELANVGKIFEDALDAKGLLSQYVVIATTPRVEVNVIWLDELIKQLQKKRSEIFAKQDRLEEEGSKSSLQEPVEDRRKRIASI